MDYLLSTFLSFFINDGEILVHDVHDVRDVHDVHDDGDVHVHNHGRDMNGIVHSISNSYMKIGSLYPHPHALNWR